MSCLYILEINSLSVALFANIFSHSKGCLFVMFMASFAVQKLLSLMRSHLFIFIFITLDGGSKKLLWCMSKSVLPMFSSMSFIVVGPLQLNDLFSSYFSLGCEAFLLFVLPTSSLAPFNTVLYPLVRTIKLKSEHNMSKSFSDSTNALPPPLFSLLLRSYPSPWLTLTGPLRHSSCVASILIIKMHLIIFIYYFLLYIFTYILFSVFASTCKNIISLTANTILYSDF